MTNTDSLYTPTVTATGSLSHKTCSHDKTARERHNCRYESAKARFAATAATRKPSEPANAPIIIGHLN